jgi:CheY-like chemotaxis protein
MKTDPIAHPSLDSEMFFESFENLMPFRVQDILLVSSLYDSFILREDGRLNELLIGESLELNLQHIPAITQVSTGREALARYEPRFNLIVTNLEVGDMDAAELAHEVKESGLDIPVVVLAYDYRKIKDFIARHLVSDIDRIFLWQGNVRILIAIVKYVEDKRNVQYDTGAAAVPVVLVVEDNIRDYSAFLPIIYTELICQSRRVINEAINLEHKLVRMRARPKILLCSNYEEAAKSVTQYKDHLFGIVSDVEFPRNGKLSAEAGFELARLVRSSVPDVPIVFQSSRTEFMARALCEGSAFLRKGSPTFLADLRQVLVEQFAFGDFVFRQSDGMEVARASDLNSFEGQLHKVPAESIAYHGQRNHFSHWLMARTELALARKLRPRKVSDFATYEHLRRDLIASIAEYRHEQSEILIGDFNPSQFKPREHFFLQIGSGSLGGKARGLAFVRHLLHRHRVARGFDQVRVAVPPTLVLATDVFDQFLSQNQLLDFAICSDDDHEIEQRFLKATLPAALEDNLRAFLAEIHYPLAVRSSSLLEDSQYLPFTGVYETFMLTNQHSGLSLRLDQLTEAIKRVYASTFSRHAKAYVRATPYRLEEEKMGVMIQQVVGRSYGTRFYPDVSGVARSRNFYPAPPAASEDGIAAVALGMGREVVGGGKCLRFCPRYPRSLLQFSSAEDMLANSQSEFWAIDLQQSADAQRSLGKLREVLFGLSAAEIDGTLHLLGSTYSADNHVVYDGLNRAGVPIVSFAPILKHGAFPLASILDQLMRVGEDALGRPVEIEFALELPRMPGEVANFGFVQIRPLVVAREGEDLPLESFVRAGLLCQSSSVMGNGRIGDLRDVMVVDPEGFERGRSREVAQVITRFNGRLSEKGIPYLLIGVGRWGSNDPWLGVPVTWDQIAGARVIVEAGFRDLRVTPSQGSHFFQNLTAFQVGYFTVNPDMRDGFVDWEWLRSQPATAEESGVRHLHFQSPLRVIMDGKTSQGMIFKPEQT